MTACYASAYWKGVPSMIAACPAGLVLFPPLMSVFYMGSLVFLANIPPVCWHLWYLQCLGCVFSHKYEILWCKTDLLPLQTFKCIPLLEKKKKKTLKKSPEVWFYGFDSDSAAPFVTVSVWPWSMWTDYSGVNDFRRNSLLLYTLEKKNIFAQEYYLGDVIFTKIGN